MKYYVDLSSGCSVLTMGKLYPVAGEVIRDNFGNDLPYRVWGRIITFSITVNFLD